MTKLSPSTSTVDGRIAGDVHANSLFIGESASIRGNIFARTAIVRGRVEGNIFVRKLQLCSTCHVKGDILHETIEIARGAFFEGNCRHSVDPLRDAK